MVVPGQPAPPLFPFRVCACLLEWGPWSTTVSVPDLVCTPRSTKPDSERPCHVAANFKPIKVRGSWLLGSLFGLRTCPTKGVQSAPYSEAQEFIFWVVVGLLVAPSRAPPAPPQCAGEPVSPCITRCVCSSFSLSPARWVRNAVSEF